MDDVWPALPSSYASQSSAAWSPDAREAAIGGITGDVLGARTGIELALPIALLTLALATNPGPTSPPNLASRPTSQRSPLRPAAHLATQPTSPRTPPHTRPPHTPAA
ncbi:hypothetical protein GCM10009743_40050 [Kribbella swartbergensis]